MKRITQSIYRGAVALLLIGAMANLTACLSDSNADSVAGPTQDEFDDLVARVEALESAGKPNRLAASGGATASGMQKIVANSAAAITDICTILNYMPSAEFPGKMNAASCKSSTGYLLTMPITTSTGTVRPGALANGRTYFETNDCSGQPYVFHEQVGDMAGQQGAVFSGYAGAEKTFYIESGSTFIVVPMNSYYEFDGSAWQCHLGGNPSGGHVFPALDNDPLITGIQDTYQGPVSMF